MEISDKSPAQINPYIKQVQPEAAEADPAAEKSRSASTEDRVELSQSAKDLSMAQAALNEIPDIRTDRVSQVKQQLDSGTYEIRSDKTAGKMIKEALINELF